MLSFSVSIKKFTENSYLKSENKWIWVLMLNQNRAHILSQSRSESKNYQQKILNPFGDLKNRCKISRSASGEISSDAVELRFQIFLPQKIRNSYLQQVWNNLSGKHLEIWHKKVSNFFKNKILLFFCS